MDNTNLQVPKILNPTNNTERILINIYSAIVSIDESFKKIAEKENIKCGDKIGRSNKNAKG